jgi:hypothetical protein
MSVILLLNETSPITFGLWLFGIPASVLYIGILILLLSRKWYKGRVIAFILAILLAILGKQEINSLDNELGLLNIMFFIPILVGLCSLYFLPLKPPKE